MLEPALFRNRPSEVDRWGSCVVRVAFVATALVLLVPGNRVLGAEDLPQPAYEPLAEAVDTLQRRLERVRGEIDQTRFDPDELVFELNFDAGEIVGFVRDEIAFHPYEGLLRGMRGTLMTRAGNSLDQSLLLAYLLKSAGLDARIAHGELEDAAVAALLAGTRRAEATSDLSGLRAAIESGFGPAAAEAGPTVDWKETGLGRQAASTAEMLRERLEAAGVTMAAAPLEQRIVEASRTYFWVEHREGPGDEWMAAHPAFGASEAPPVEPEGYMSEKVDERFHHELTFEAWIRRRQGDAVSDHRLMKPWTRPAAPCCATSHCCSFQPASGSCSICP